MEEASILCDYPQAKRNYGIDLLRAILMLMVCVLHILWQGGVIKACADEDTKNNIYWLIETLMLCAVDGYALISGYTASQKCCNYTKLVKMWGQVWFYSFITTFVLWVLGLAEDISIDNLIRCALPITFNVFWYFTAYFVLYLIKPFIDRILFSCDTTLAKKCLIVLFVLFSVVNIVTDTFHTNYGCSFLWLLVLYCIGVLSKIAGLFDKKNNAILLLIFFGCCFITWIIYILTHNMLLMEYTSPFILLCAISIVILFSRLDIKRNYVIIKITPCVFGVYLLQCSPVIWSRMADAFAFIADLDLVTGVAYVFLIALGMFSCGILVEMLRQWVVHSLGEEKISKKIVSVISVVLDKAVR